ncbi:Myotubularin protein 9 [Paragonimus heterotremus]|uniref:Myotubularin protein 9 n=1 Tax=Paragonimus heterotremus TaxID=100268 RepID=A0A8J4TDG9_9TREM|nr:Myotubularin protein 9 [Paragonimus heterotremus]
MELASLIKVNNISGCKLCGPNMSLLLRKLVLTNHHLLFVSDGEDFSLLYMSIDAVRLLDAVAERRYVSSGQSGFTLALYTKLFCIYELTIPGLNDARALQQSLEALINIENPVLLYPFFYKPDFNHIQKVPTAVDSRDDLREALTTNRWRVCMANKGYGLCSTYPEEVIVPAEVPDSVVIESAGFRRGGRFPLLVYYHRPRETALLIASEPAGAQFTAPSGNQGIFNTITTMTMPSNPMRSSPFSTGSPQRTGTTVPPNGPTVTGLSGSNNTAVNRCRADEQFLASVLLDRHRGAIVDLRDQISSKKSVNYASGVVESEPNYPQWRRVCRPMESATNLNTIFRKFIEVCIASGRNARSAGFNLASPSALADSLSVLATAALGPTSYEGNTLKSNSLTDAESLNTTFMEENTVDSMASYSPTTSFTPDKTSDGLRVAGLNTNAQAAYKVRRISAWLNAVRDALAAAVAGATALDARDAFAQQQLQQEQCLLMQKYKEQKLRHPDNGQDQPTRLEAKLRGSFVLIQSAQGRDRALVVSSLIQVILNPASRTLSGFQDLVEHTWLRSGHPFGDRCRHSTLSGRSLKHEAPVFLLFLDSVWQLWRQYPTVFEFTDELLCLLAQHVYYSEFGTFLGNSMKERDDLGIHEKTTSIWSYLQQPCVREQYTNPLYDTGDHLSGTDKDNYTVCWPCLAPQALDVWRELYQRQQFPDPVSLWNKPRQAAYEITNQFHNEMKHVQHLQAVLKSLQQEAVASGLLIAGSAD